MTELHYRLIPGPEAGPESVPARLAVFLHGILGSGRNWASVARRVVNDRPEWTAALLDLRMHGDSVGFVAPHTVVAAADDVMRLIERLAPGQVVIIGHSFGGKVALECARRWEGPLRQVWVMDATPSAGLSRGNAARLIGALGRLPDRFDSREELMAILGREGFAPRVGMWMATNLDPTGDGLRWRFSLSAIHDMLADFAVTDLWSVVEDSASAVELHFVRATESDYIVGADRERLLAASADSKRVYVHDVEGGHWLNMDNPEALIELLDTWLP